MTGGDFDGDDAAGFEEGSAGSEDVADEIEAISAATQGDVRFVVFDVWLDGIPLVIGDVGGIADEVAE
jgi:hypothetical protein